MIKLYKSKDLENHFEVADVLLQTDNYRTIDELCEVFANFLRACGYVFSGSIGIVEDEIDEEE